MTTWNDFNDAEPQVFDLIPKGTVVPVRMTIKPGGFDDHAQGWTSGWATQSYETGSVYLACEFVVLAGDYAKRKVWSNIGLYSPKGSTWTQMGRSFIRGVLNSARNLHPKDLGPDTAAKRFISGFHELDGIEFLARIDVEKDGRDELKNVIKVAVEPDHPDYARLMGVASQVAAPAAGPAYFPSAQPAQAAHPAAPSAARPAPAAQGYHPAAQPATAVARPAHATQPANSRSPVSAKPSWAQ
ncbi:hypothetical protein [Caldimonas brevitalea]|uniref:Uncharacterized protein n=1 Tax=Caldimonas brevitalea TaxID=413882 RepID=A0A0G3BMI3_9BURK|nr:hypothetical protein [Caldimonas brevitalea]AKJ30654.1 hypothetical protein AAW51_3963 [Caldimonas brevitalea]